LSLDVLSPATGASGRGPIAVVARAVSATKAPKDLSVWARVGTGAYVALVLRDDGTFQGSLPIGAAASGTTLPVTVVTTDYVTAVERTAGYRVVR
ncbi:MAG TPA: hypothetical protein VJ804_14475, partial [Acidimicrobiales bacterium]|nr:hypothetical protein [Acidimicrobiales bacterium]